jgi:hypothetical protein
MFDEGIASRGTQDQVAVDDIAVYVARSMRRAATGDASAPLPPDLGLTRDSPLP